MSFPQFTEDQMNLLNEAAEKIGWLFSLLSKFEPIAEVSHSSMKFKEGFMWLTEAIKIGTMISNEINKEPSTFSNPVDEEKK